MGGIIKYYRMSYDEILHKRSYKNLILLNASIPSFKGVDEGKGKRKMIHHANELFDRML